MSQLYGLLFWIIIAGLVAKCVRVFWLPKIKGAIGEHMLDMTLKSKLDPSIYRVLQNLTLPTHDGTTQIDHVVVSRYGIFVIETKTYDGWIFGGERDAQWTQMIYKRKYRFQNPLRQNYKHTKTLSDLTGIPHELFKSMVLFSGHSTFKTDMPENVMHFKGASYYINDHRSAIALTGIEPGLLI